MAVQNAAKIYLTVIIICNVVMIGCGAVTSISGALLASSGNGVPAIFLVATGGVLVLAGVVLLIVGLSMKFMRQANDDRLL